MKPFTKREKEVLDLVDKACQLKKIADILGIKENTVHTYMAKIHSKTDTHSIAELMNWIAKHRKR